MNTPPHTLPRNNYNQYAKQNMTLGLLPPADKCVHLSASVAELLLFASGHVCV